MRVLLVSQFCPPRPCKPVRDYSAQNPFRWVYVSIVNFYKHQWNVAEAAARLRGQGLPIAVELVGPAYGPALARLTKTQARLDPRGEFIRYLGPVPHSRIAAVYAAADAFVFASSCETFGEVVLEAMASGLPIACSNRGPMPEVLGDAGVYFDPEEPDTIARAMRRLMEDEQLRQRCAQSAYERSAQFNWERCARETFAFLAEASQSHREHAGGKEA